MTVIPLGPWAIVLRLQRAVSLPAVGPRVFGFDETLEVVLDGIARGEVPDERRIENLCANRAGKDRHRRRLARRHGVEDSGVCVIEAVHTKRMVEFAKSVLGEKDFATLLEVGDGSYREVAFAERVPVGTLKARVARARAKVRDAHVARFGFPQMSATNPGVAQ